MNTAQTRRACLAGIAITGLAACATDADAAARGRQAGACAVDFGREDFERYARLFTAYDRGFLDYYADQVTLAVGGKNLVGKQAIWDWFGKLRENFTETMDPIWFCSDATGLSAELRGAYRCIKSIENSEIFGRSVQEGMVRRIEGIVLYDLENGKISRMRGAKPTVISDWRLES